MHARGPASKALFVTLFVALFTVLSSAPSSGHVPPEWWKERRHVKQRARSQVGARYRYGGRSPRGFDCSGFTRWTFNEHGAKLPHSSADQFRLARRDGHERIWKRKNVEIGDLVFHKTSSARVGHVGIYIGNGRFISSTSSEGVRIRSLYDRYYWGRRWVGATRLPVTARP